MGRGGVHQGEAQELGDRRRRLARLAVLRGALERKVRATALGAQKNGVPLGRIRVPGLEPDNHGVVVGQAVCLAPHGDQQPPLLENRTAAGVQNGPAPTEHQAAAHRHEGEAHQQDQRPGPGRDVSGVFQRHDPGRGQSHEDPGSKEGETENRETAPALLDLELVRRDLPNHGRPCHAHHPVNPYASRR